MQQKNTLRDISLYKIQEYPLSKVKNTRTPILRTTGLSKLRLFACNPPNHAYRCQYLSSYMIIPTNRKQKQTFETIGTIDNSSLKDYKR